MDQQLLLQYYLNHPEISDLQQTLEKSAVKLHFKGLAGSSSALFLNALFQKLKRPFLIVLNDREEASYFCDDMQTIAGSDDVLFFPSSYKRSAQYGKVEHENIVLRTEAMNRLAKGGALCLISYPEALNEKVISQDGLVENTLFIRKGEKLSTDFINEVLYEYGFERVDFVYEPGQFSVRGGIIDIFSFSNEEPYRIDFFGDEVDSIRSFNIEDQLSIDQFDEIAIIPDIQQGLKEEDRISFFELLPKNTVLNFADVQFCADRLSDITNEAIELSEQIPDLLNGKSFIADLEAFSLIEFGLRKHFSEAQEIQFQVNPQPVFQKNFDLLAQTIKQYDANGFQSFIISSNQKQIDRLNAIFDDRDFNVPFQSANFVLHEGFIDKELKICVFTDHQIFERYHRYKKQSKSSAKETITLKELTKLHPGDYVVHIDHGIGKFAGLVKQDVNGKVQEAIRLVYRDDDSLLVNIHSLHRISKYKGKDGTEPNLNKLGTAAWQNLKKKTKSKVKDIARELIALYVKRREERGFAFAPDSYLQTELEASFIFEDTPDQEKVTTAVKEDMEKELPMDRLVCGDVGFGKTEIAIRAAFKAVADNKQVAVLVPTTILALQHYRTFTERLKEFPAKIGYISRLRTAKEIRETLKGLAEGKIDIIIGTHKLIGKDVKFNDLGLLIVDEEQKFGVSVKEKLKQLKVNVDTLTLTATPIPRTLQFSLMGARDLSIIQTPPPNRYPILTEVHGFNENIVREAINYELDRGGQVFFINNRVQNIYEMEAFIKKACPGVKTVVGHGQMEGPKLEKIMLDFIDGKYDVLVATTIIESGLDIPNANTIIINNANNFGLSDLHQLRGRVGRSNKKAFCYLLSPPLSALTPEARRRMKAIEEFSDLGSGFNIAMQDLDIRGAGNLLGGEQSGFIADIGFETYHRILNEALLELRQNDFSEAFEEENRSEDASKAFLNVKFVEDCQIDTDLEIRFPEDYVNSISERMALYRELDNIENNEALDLFIEKIIDRFGKDKEGKIPDQVNELFEVVRLRNLAISLGLEKIILKGNKMIGHFVSDQNSPFYQSEAFTKVLMWVQHNPGKCRMKEARNKLSIVFEAVTSVREARMKLLQMG